MGGLAIPLAEPIGVDAEVEAENHQLVEQGGLPDADGGPAPIVGGDGGGGEGDFAAFLQGFDELKVFHDREVGEAADRFKGFALEEDRLVAVGQLAVARSPVAAPFDEAAAELWGVDFEVEGSGDGAGLGEGSFDVGEPVGGEVGVGMEEHKEVTLGDRGGLVHLVGATGGGGEDDCVWVKLGGDGEGTIGAATVGDDDFDIGGVGDVGEGLGESRGFVEGGDDDGDAGHDWVGFYLFAIGHTIQQS
ncbi:MAG: hypothetical protein RLZZ511_862 [Cyanobacteriota bacterium]